MDFVDAYSFAKLSLVCVQKSSVYKLMMYIYLIKYTCVTLNQYQKRDTYIFLACVQSSSLSVKKVNFESNDS